MLDFIIFIGRINYKYYMEDLFMSKYYSINLVEDLVQIITVFSCKLQGKRANKAKKLIRELIQEETDGKSHKSNADTKQCTEN